MGPSNAPTTKFPRQVRPLGGGVHPAQPRGRHRVRPGHAPDRGGWIASEKMSVLRGSDRPPWVAASSLRQPTVTSSSAEGCKHACWSVARGLGSHRKSYKRNFFYASEVWTRGQVRLVRFVSHLCCHRRLFVFCLLMMFLERKTVNSTGGTLYEMLFASVSAGLCQIPCRESSGIFTGLSSGWVFPAMVVSMKLSVAIGGSLFGLCFFLRTFWDTCWSGRLASLVFSGG